MEIITLSNNIKVFGLQVKTFPLGIGETFEKLMKMLSDNFNRSYYGISYMKNDEMVYLAMAIETYEGEGTKYNCETYTIAKGNYISEQVTEWRNKTDCIKDIFYKIIQDEYADKTKPAIEWYKNDNEMCCMIQSI